MELCNNVHEKIENNEIIDTKKEHVGYYLISEGKEELLNNLLDKKVSIKIIDK